MKTGTAPLYCKGYETRQSHWETGKTRNRHEAQVRDLPEQKQSVGGDKIGVFRIMSDTIHIKGGPFIGPPYLVWKTNENILKDH